MLTLTNLKDLYRGKKITYVYLIVHRYTCMQWNSQGACKYTDIWWRIHKLYTSWTSHQILKMVTQKFVFNTKEFNTKEYIKYI